MTYCNACKLEIYQNTSQFNRYYCRVVAGEAGFVGATVVFQPVRTLYEIPLNGPGRNKAKHKVITRLKTEGLDFRILNENADIKIIPKA